MDIAVVYSCITRKYLLIFNSFHSRYSEKKVPLHMKNKIVFQISFITKSFIYGLNAVCFLCSTVVL